MRLRVVPLDNYEPCVAYMKREIFRARKCYPIEKWIFPSPEALTLSRYRPDTVVCINVLEHVRVYDAAISKYFKGIRKRRDVYTSLAPAFQFLYGSIDRLVGHFRRYNKKKRELKGKLTGAGFNIKEIFYMNSVALFLDGF